MEQSTKPAAAKRRRVFRWLRALLLILLLVLITPCIVLCGYVFRHIDYDAQADPWSTYDGICRAEDYDLTETVHTLTTADGLSIRCSEVRADEPRAVIIYLTGVERPSVSYFYAHAAWMHQNGVACFLPELRAHGESEGKKLGLGYTETEDIRAVLSLIGSDPTYDDLPIVIHGLSMGGAAAINAFGVFPQIDACIAGSAYASFEYQMEDIMASMGVPEFLRRVEAPFLSLTLRLLYGWRTAEEMTPVRQIQNADGRPVLLMVCTGDGNVAAVNTDRLHEACPAAQVWKRETADHYVVWNSDLCRVQNDLEYCDTVLSFLREAGIVPE